MTDLSRPYLVTRHTAQEGTARVTRPHLLASHAFDLAKAAAYRAEAQAETHPEMRRAHITFAGGWVGMARGLRIHNTVAYRPRLPG